MNLKDLITCLWVLLSEGWKGLEMHINQSSALNSSIKTWMGRFSHIRKQAGKRYWPRLLGLMALSYGAIWLGFGIAYQGIVASVNPSSPAVFSSNISDYEPSEELALPVYPINESWVRHTAHEFHSQSGISEGGTVEFWIYVDAEGKTQHPYLIDYSSAALVGSAEQAIKQLRCLPAIRGKKTVAGWLSFRFTFPEKH